MEKNPILGEPKSEEFVDALTKQDERAWAMINANAELLKLGDDDPRTEELRRLIEQLKDVPPEEQDRLRQYKLASHRELEEWLAECEEHEKSIAGAVELLGSTAFAGVKNVVERISYARHGQSWIERYESVLQSIISIASLAASAHTERQLENRYMEDLPEDTKDKRELARAQIHNIRKEDKEDKMRGVKRP